MWYKLHYGDLLTLGNPKGRIPEVSWHPQRWGLKSLLKSRMPNPNYLASEEPKAPQFYFSIKFNISLTVEKEKECLIKGDMKGLKPADCISGILKRHILTSWWSHLRVTFVSYAILALFSILVICGYSFIKDRQWLGNWKQIILSIKAHSRQHFKWWNLAVNWFQRNGHISGFAHGGEENPHLHWVCTIDQ